MVMPHTPRHSARFATKATESPVNSRNPVQSRSSLPRRTNASHDEMGDSTQAVPLDSPCSHDDIPPPPNSPSQQGLQHTTLSPRRVVFFFVSLATSNSPPGPAATPARYLSDEHSSPYQPNKVNSTAQRQRGRLPLQCPRPVAVSLPLLDPCPAVASTPYTCRQAITDLPGLRTSPTCRTLSLQSEPGRSYTAPFRPHLPYNFRPHTAKREALHELLGLAAQFSSDGLRAAVEDLPATTTSLPAAPASTHDTRSP